MFSFVVVNERPKVGLREGRGNSTAAAGGAGAGDSVADILKISANRLASELVTGNIDLSSIHQTSSASSITSGTVYTTAAEVEQSGIRHHRVPGSGIGQPKMMASGILGQRELLIPPPLITGNGGGATSPVPSLPGNTGLKHLLTYWFFIY